MRTRVTGLRTVVALFVAVVMVIAGPLHAAHNHGHDVDHLHGPCAICKSQSPASEPLPQTPAGIVLEPVGELAWAAVSPPLTAYETTIASRAPPRFLA